MILAENHIYLIKESRGELPTKIHLGNCPANNCPYRDTIRPMVERLTGVEVIEGTHPYKSAEIFKPVSADKK